MKTNYPAKKVNKTKYVSFVKVANSFKEASELAEEFGYYNASGVLIIHAAIALADAITIKLTSKKAKGDSHYDVVVLLKSAFSNKSNINRAVNHFEKLIDHKNIVSYSGDIYHKKDIIKLFKHYERFETWVNTILD